MAMSTRLVSTTGTSDVCTLETQRGAERPAHLRIIELEDGLRLDTAINSTARCTRFLLLFFDLFFWGHMQVLAKVLASCIVTQSSVDQATRVWYERGKTKRMCGRRQHAFGQSLWPRWPGLWACGLRTGNRTRFTRLTRQVSEPMDYTKITGDRSDRSTCCRRLEALKQK